MRRIDVGARIDDSNVITTLDDASLKEGLELVWFATGKDDFLIETSRATVAMLEALDEPPAGLIVASPAIAATDEPAFTALIASNASAHVASTIWPPLRT